MRATLSRKLGDISECIWRPGAFGFARSSIPSVFPLLTDRDPARFPARLARPCADNASTPWFCSAAADEGRWIVFTIVEQPFMFPLLAVSLTIMHVKHFLHSFLVSVRELTPFFDSIRLKPPHPPFHLLISRDQHAHAFSRQGHQLGGVSSFKNPASVLRCGSGHR